MVWLYGGFGAWFGWFGCRFGVVRVLLVGCLGVVIWYDCVICCFCVSGFDGFWLLWFVWLYSRGVGWCIVADFWILTLV